jgi:hypothetical protein
MLVRSAVLMTVTAALAGCGSISSTLGLERHVPDETQVVVRPTLTLPPDYDLMPPGTPSAVSAEHEVGSPTASASDAPKKEERGFFGSLFHGDFFGNDVDATTAKEHAAAASTSNVDAAPPAPVSTPPAATDAPPADAAQAPAPKKDEPGFFGRLFSGDLF